MNAVLPHVVSYLSMMIGPGDGLPLYQRFYFDVAHPFVLEQQHRPCWGLALVHCRHNFLISASFGNHIAEEVEFEQLVLPEVLFRAVGCRADDPYDAAAV
jgi:hypothetical protein